MHGFSLSLPPSRGMLEETASLFFYERVRESASPRVRESASPPVRESASPGPPVRESGSAFYPHPYIGSFYWSDIFFIISPANDGILVV